MDAAMKMTGFTIEDIYALPEGQRAELIDGQMHMMAAPNTAHQRISRIISNEIYNYITSKNGSCESFTAPFAVFPDADDKCYLEPDIVIVCDKDKLTERGCAGAPDLVVEIVSPSSRTMDYFKKLFKYRTCGVREYWLVDHLKNHIIVYCFGDGGEGTVCDYTFSDKVKVGIFKDLEIDFSKMSI